MKSANYRKKGSCAMHLKVPARKKQNHHIVYSVTRGIMALISLIAAMPVLGGCNMQKKMLYYPSEFPPSEQTLKEAGLKPWECSGSDYRGLISTDDNGHGKGTIVVFHGNGGTAADRAFYVKALGPLGYRVILAEYPLYGGRKGEVGEKPFVKDAKETLRLALKDYGGPLFVLGESLGCGVAAAAVRDSPAKLEGIVLITPWDTLASIAGEKFPYLPVRWFLTDEYDTITNLKSFKGRIAVVGAERDQIIPIGHAKNLFDSLPGTAGKKFSEIPWVGHNDWPMAVTSSWWKEIMEFVDDKKNG